MDIHDIAPVDIDIEIAALEVERDDLKQDARTGRWGAPIAGLVIFGSGPSFMQYFSTDQMLILLSAAAIYIGITEKLRSYRFNQINSEINHLKLWLEADKSSAMRTMRVARLVEAKIPAS